MVVQSIQDKPRFSKHPLKKESKKIAKMNLEIEIND
jgi:hypothetical protein